MKSLRISENIEDGLSKAMIRTIAETGAHTRNKAINLGILPPNLKTPETIWIDKAQGDGYKEFPYLNHENLHDHHKVEQLTWAVCKDGKIILSSPTW